MDQQNPQTVSNSFLQYRTQHPTQAPNLTRQQHEDELWDLSPHADVYALDLANTQHMTVGTPPTATQRGDHAHLWVITADDVLVALEAGEAGRSTTRGRLSHTNLTGGRPAHAGGEMWYHSPTQLWLTGGSSRYAPRSARELEDIARALEACGYEVFSCGWDEQIGGPMRFFRALAPWEEGA
jgi:hypothetical protein